MSTGRYWVRSVRSPAPTRLGDELAAPLAGADLTIQGHLTQRILGLLRGPDVTHHSPQDRTESQVIMQVFGGARLRGVWEVVKTWVTGRHEVARERTDCATSEAILRDLPSGGIWLDRDGDRLRLIIKPMREGATCLPQLQQAARLLELQSTILDPRLEHGDDSLHAE